MSEIPKIDFRSNMNKIGYTAGDTSLDESDAYLYQNVIKKLTPRCTVIKSERGKNKKYRLNEYYENYSGSKKIKSDGLFQEKEKRKSSYKKYKFSKKRNPSNTSKKLYNFKKNHKFRHSTGSNNSSSKLFLKKARLKAKKMREEQQRSYKNNKIRKEFLNPEDEIAYHEKRANKKRGKEVRRKVTNEEIWNYVGYMSKQTLLNFIIKLQDYYKIKFQKNNIPFLTNSTVENFSKDSKKIKDKSELASIKKELDEVKAFLNDFKRQQKEIDLMRRVNYFADLDQKKDH